MNYKTIQSPTGDTVIFYEENSVRVSFVDPSPGNTDYQRFLEWVAAGGIPEPWNGA